MSKAPLSSDRFDEQSEEINVDSDRAVNYAGFDYKHDWKGFLGESDQNSYDGWCNNRLRGDIPDEQPLNIHIEVFVDENRVVHRDNAGGMREGQFERYTDLNQPGEDKLKYESGGDQGRGFHVLGQLGGIVQVETYNPHYRGGVEVRHNKRVFRDFDELELYGTEINILECDPDEVDHLSDMDNVEEYLQSRFQRMLEHEEVAIKVTVHEDGESESRLIRPVDLDQFDVLYGPENISFEFRGDEYLIEDFVVYDRDNQDVPFGPIEMYKGHEAKSRAYMRVKSYRPLKLANVDKVFSFCDASSLRDFETAGHTDYKHDIHQESPLRDILSDVLEEEFGSDPINTQEFDDIREQARNLFNENVELDIFDNRTESDFDTDVPTDEDEEDPDETIDEEGNQPNQRDDSEADGEGVNINQWLASEKDQDHKSDNDSPEEEEENEEEESPKLRCEIIEGREVDQGESVHIRPVVENPPDSDVSEFSIRGEIEEADGGTSVELDNLIMEVPEGKGDTGSEWEFDPPDGVSGRLVFRGELYKKGARTNTLDDTHTWFYVGESAPGTAPSGSPFKEIFFTKEKSDEYRYVVNQEGEGLIIFVNAMHPEFREANDKDGKKGIENRAKLTFEYMMEAAYQTVAERAIYDKIGDVPIPDDERYDNAADAVSELLTNQMVRRIDRALASYYG